MQCAGPPLSLVCACVCPSTAHHRPFVITASRLAEALSCRNMPDLVPRRPVGTTIDGNDGDQHIYIYIYIYIYS